MEKIFLTLFIFLVSLLASAEVKIPPLTGPVIDNGAFFTAQETEYIGRKLQSIYQSGGPQIQVWTIESLEDEEVSQLGIRATDVWKIGRAGKDDGALLIIAKNERVTDLEVGRGLEGIITDTLAYRILQNTLRPALRAGKPAEGVINVASEIATLVGIEGYDPVPVKQSPLNKLFSSNLFFLIFFLFFVISRLFGSRRSFRGSYWGGGGGFGGGGGRSGGGGWSGGGGGFSGGGSSGSW